MSRLDGLRSYHRKRRDETAVALIDAMERMLDGRTVIIPPGSKLTKSNLAKEAGVNVNTVVAKNPDGSFVFAEANRMFEQCLKPPKKDALGICRLRIADLEATVRRLQRTIAGMSAETL